MNNDDDDMIVMKIFIILFILWASTFLSLKLIKLIW